MRDELRQLRNKAVTAMVIFGVAYGGIFLHSHLDAKLSGQSHLYVRTKGIVTHSEVITQHGRSKKFKLNVAFSVNGKSYRATPGIFGVIDDDTMSPEALHEAYPVNAPYPVWYLPSDPSNTYLKPPDENRSKYRGEFILVTIALGLTITWMARRLYQVRVIERR